MSGAVINSALQTKFQPQLAKPESKLWGDATQILMDKYKNPSPQPTPTDVGTLVDWLRDLCERDYTQSAIQALKGIVNVLHLEVAWGTPGVDERQRVKAWVQTARSKPDYSTLTQVNGLVQNLVKANVHAKTIGRLWDTLGAPNVLKQGVLKVLVESKYEWIGKAIIHCRETNPDPNPMPPVQFWMVPFVTANNLADVAGKLYSHWKKDGRDQPWCRTLNQYADGLQLISVPQRMQFMEMFNPAEWGQMVVTWLAATNQQQPHTLRQRVLNVRSQVDETAPRKKVASQGAGELGGTVTATNKDLGGWFLHHKELLCELLHLGYPENVLAEMYRQGLRHREMLTLTWFRGVAASSSQNLAILVTIHNVGSRNGHPVHIAERHLYPHFKFDSQPRWPGDNPIKAKNTFFPWGTTQANLPGHLNLTFDSSELSTDPDDNKSQVASKNGYKFHFREYGNAKSKRVATVYPDPALPPYNFYLKYELERMKAVADLLPTPLPNTLPEINWRLAPRGDRID